jgi:hydrogenase small subunit
MNLNRRDFLKASAAVAGALALKGSGLMQLQKAMAADSANIGAPVIWLQGQSCTGCSVSLLNSIHHMTVDDLLLNTINLKYHPTVMAAAGDLAVGAAVGAAPGYVLIVEGSIPVGAAGHYCHVWEDENHEPVTMETAFDDFRRNAGYILSVGTCASYGGLGSQRGIKLFGSTEETTSDRNQYTRLSRASGLDHWNRGGVISRRGAGTGSRWQTGNVLRLYGPF